MAPTVHNRQALEKVLKNPKTRFLSLDFENTQAISGLAEIYPRSSDGERSHGSQMGTVQLRLHEWIDSAKNGTVVPSLRASNFYTGPDDYLTERSRKQELGDYQRVNMSDFAKNTIKFFLSLKEEGSPLVLVGHSVKHKIECLQARGIEPNNFFDYILDTSFLCCKSRRVTTKSMGLGDLLVAHGDPVNVSTLHNAVHDAAYTLRLMVKLVLDNMNVEAAIHMGLNRFYNFGFSLERNPTRLSKKDTTTRRSREVPGMTFIVNNEGKWKGPWAYKLNHWWTSRMLLPIPSGKTNSCHARIAHQARRAHL